MYTATFQFFRRRRLKLFAPKPFNEVRRYGKVKTMLAAPRRLHAPHAAALLQATLNAANSSTYGRK